MNKFFPVVLIIVALSILGVTLALTEQKKAIPVETSSPAVVNQITKKSIDPSELNKITSECEKLNGSVSKENGKTVCICPQKNPEGKTESAYCVQDLISEFESN